MVRLASLVCALALALPAIAAAAPGDRDPAFSGDGLVRQPGLPPAVAVAVDDARRGAGRGDRDRQAAPVSMR